jgi:hypothetical protein
MTGSDEQKFKIVNGIKLLVREKSDNIRQWKNY